MNARFIRKALLFVVPHFGVAILFGPVAVVLGGIYAKYYGLSLAEIALVMLIAKVFDAVSDPCVGYCSDRWHASGRSRRTLIAIGAFLLIPSAYFLYIPAGDPNSLYFGFWYVLLYFSLTLFTIPYLSWINEFTSRKKSGQALWKKDSTKKWTGTYKKEKKVDRHFGKRIQRSNG